MWGDSARLPFPAWCDIICHEIQTCSQVGISRDRNSDRLNQVIHVAPSGGAVTDPITTLGFALHTCNSESLVAGAPTTVTASRLLHTMGYALEGADGPKFNDNSWALLRLLRTPRIVIRTADVLDEIPEQREHFRYALLLPQNTAGDTSANLMSRAVSFVGSEAISALKAGARLEMGTMHRIPLVDNRRFDEVWHVVCREPGNAAVQRLDQALGDLIGWSDVSFGGSGDTGKRLRLVIPLWGGEATLGQWADALAKLATARVDIQRNEPSVILGVLPEEEALATRLESELVLRGAMVGHQWLESYSAEGCLWAQPEVKERIAASVSINGPLHPDHYAQWLLSGVALEPGGWERHLRSLTSS